MEMLRASPFPAPDSDKRVSSAASDGGTPRNGSPPRTVGFGEMPKAKKPANKVNDVMQAAMARYAEARAKMAEAASKQQKAKAEATGGGSSGPSGSSSSSFSVPGVFRTLGDVKGLPSSRNHSRSASRHPSGARSLNDSFSQATTALTVRSAMQISSDRAFKSASKSRAELNAEAEERAKWLDLAPLDHGQGTGGVGTDNGRVWKKHLREVVPHASKGDPVANNSLSKNGIRTPSTPGLFLQIPERLGRWHDNYVSDEKAGGGRGQWVPEAEVRRRERMIAAQEKKAREEEERREREMREQLERERIRREEEAALAREAAQQALEMKERERIEAQARADKKRADEKKKKQVVAPSCLRRQATNSTMGAGGK